jgi:phage head maturation protease
VQLISASEGGVAANPAKRQIEGLIVPFGLEGPTSAGLFTYGPGSLSWAKDVRRVKMLREHDRRDSVGFGAQLDEVDAAEADRRLVELGRDPLGLAGVWGRFTVPPSPEGDLALAEAHDGRRDAFSVGVEMDAATETAARRSRDGKAIKASGKIREVSLVAIPAFDDARVGAAATADPQTLVVAAWRDQSTPPEGTAPMTDTAQATDTTTDVAPTADASSTTTDTTTDAGPSTVAATAGAAATVTAEPPVYNFDGTGPSFVRDAWNARMVGDRDAQDRLSRFQSAMTSGDPGQLLALAAVMTRTGNDEIIPSQYKPNLLIDVVDKGRPLWTRAGVRVTLTDATPFTIPVLGEFDGVGAHTEGTAHVAEGTQALDKRTVTPGAMSGAFRVSREMIDAANPAIDRIVVAGMMRDYRRATEALVWAAIVAADAAADASVNTVLELRAQLIAFAAANSDIPADFVAASPTAFATLANDVAGDGRPQLPYVGPTNVVGTVRAGYTGASVDGVEIANVSSVAATEMVAVRADALLVGEGKVQTFRFDEVEGPGVIKFALWAYAAAQVIDATGVERFTTA